MARSKIAYGIYDLFLAVAAIFLIPYFVIRNLILRRPVFPYFQLPSKTELDKIKGKPVIWMQAVSVGETVVAKVILDELQKRLPDHAFVFTNTTPTGQAMARKILPASVCLAYFPFDLPFMVRRFLKAIRPSLLILVETEIWPNAIRQAKLSGCKVAIVNGIISDRSFKRYQKFRFFIKEVFGHCDLFAMQSAENANRIGALGAPLERVQVSGNSKFDQTYPEIKPEQIEALLEQYGWSKETPVFTAASTHRGEEEIILSAYRQLLNDESYNLILAPRHPERADEVIALLKERQFGFFQRSQPVTGQKASILLMDTFGELGLAYAAADVVFVGGSLANVGGHNVLEAAAQAKPVMYGPYMHKSRPSKQLLEEADAGFTVRDDVETVRTIKELTADRTVYKKRAENARKVVVSNQGASHKTVDLLIALLRK